MKKSIATICTALMIMILSSGIALAGNGRLGNNSKAAQDGNAVSNGSGITFLAYEEPDAAEISALTYMVEEEKLARDVYNALYETFSIPVFANIAAAEQRHMNAIISLLDKYGLENPALLEAGQFVNPDLQTLYNNLVAAGQVNEEEALLVGTTIEDVDIYDLNHELELVDNEDITRVFENLRRGSENHLRAFSALLTLYGYAPYAAQFLTQEEIDEILAAPRSQGGNANAKGGSMTRQSRMVDADGDGVCDFLQQ